MSRKRLGKKKPVETFKTGFNKAARNLNLLNPKNYDKIKKLIKQEMAIFHKNARAGLLDQSIRYWRKLDIMNIPARNTREYAATLFFDYFPAQQKDIQMRSIRF